MTLPANKTKIVCTIGSASESPEIMEEMILAGMNVARLNLSHGDFASHKKVIENLRAAARAESTDVANAILDGTDCVMLSEESAMGRYPVEATAMLAKIAVATEPHRPGYRAREELKQCGLDCNARLTDLLALSVETAVETVSPAAVIVPSLTGASARSIARFRLPVWIGAVSSDEGTCQKLQFSYGVHPLHVPETVENWNVFARVWVQSHGLEGDLVILSTGPSPEHPEANNRMEIIDLRASS